METLGAVEIRGKVWHVAQEEDPRDEDGNCLAGYCDRSKRIIVVDSLIEPDDLDRAKTLIHEACHAVSDDMSESLVADLENAIAAVLVATGYLHGED